MHLRLPPFLFFFFFNDTATPEIYTLSLHDALPISIVSWCGISSCGASAPDICCRSEEHTSELQSRFDLVCRLLLEKKKKNQTRTVTLTLIPLIDHLRRRAHAAHYRRHTITARVSQR